MISHTSAVAAAAAPITDDNEILVIDSDPAIGGGIVEELIQDGFAAVHGQSAGHARSLARHQRIDAVVLGELAGARSALDLLSEIRCAHDGSCWVPSVPVVLLSDRTGEGDLTRAFARGADDFIARSASYVELLVRLQAGYAVQAAMSRHVDSCGSSGCARQTPQRVGASLTIQSVSWRELSPLRPD